MSWNKRLPRRSGKTLVNHSLGKVPYHSFTPHLSVKTNRAMHHAVRHSREALPASAVPGLTAFYFSPQHNASSIQLLTSGCCFKKRLWEGSAEVWLANKCLRNHPDRGAREVRALPAGFCLVWGVGCTKRGAMAHLFLFSLGPGKLSLIRQLHCPEKQWTNKPISPNSLQSFKSTHSSTFQSKFPCWWLYLVTIFYCQLIEATDGQLLHLSSSLQATHCNTN